MSGSSPNLSVVLGGINGTPIVANLDGADLSKRQAVTLSANYVRSPPPDFPNSSPGTGNQTNYTAFPQTIPSGTVVVFLEAEATALVNSGAATLGATVSNG